MGLLSLGNKLSKVSKKLNAMDLSNIDTPAVDKSPKVLEDVPLNLKLTNVDNDLSDEALEMLGDEKAIKDWKNNNKVPIEESKRRKQRKFAKQARDLQQGIMSGPEYRKYIKENQPATSFTFDDLQTMLPNFKQIVGALTKDKSDKGILGLNSKLEKGSIVSSRLDIPAYNEHNVWVTSIVDKVKGKLYGRTAVLKDVNFDMTNEGAKQLALDIATEKKKTIKRLNKETGERVAKEETQTKTPFATMKGKWQDVSDKNAFSLAKKYINDPDWIQVGFNPERHSFFYDKVSMLPVFEAEEVVQVGALVLAKVKKLNTPELRAERIKKLKKLRITNMPEGSKPSTFNKGGVVPMNNQMSFFGEGGLKDEGGEIDEVSGNEVPIGGTKEGVRDDIPANVSEGEFIFPEDVVRFIGLDKLMKIRQNAKMGLKKMEAMGQMGNSDEATIDDDMPFEMADLIVVGGKGEPMKFADGGFVPVQNFQEGGQVTLPTAPVPTFNPDEVADYDAYMSSVSVEVKVYVNADGEKINVTFIDGVPTLPIEPGYTLYVPPEEGAETTTEEEIAAAINNKNRDRDTEPYRESTAPKQINYAALSPEDFAARMEYESSKGYRLQKAVALGISSLVPFGAGLAYGTMRGHARQSEIRLNEMIANATTEELKAKYTTIRDNFLKANGLQPSSESGVIAKWVDSFLVGSGINPEAATDAASAVNAFTQVGSYSIESDKLAQVLADPNFEQIDLDAAKEQSYQMGRQYASQLEANAQMFPNDLLSTPGSLVDGNVQSDKYPTLGQVKGSPASQRGAEVQGTNDPRLSAGVDPFAPPTKVKNNLTLDDVYTRQANQQMTPLAVSIREKGSPAPVQTGDPNIVTDTSSVGQRPATYDPAQFGRGEPVAQKKSNDGLFQQKTIAGFGSKLLDLAQGNYFKEEETPSVTSTEPYTPQQFTNQFSVPNQQLPESIPQQQQSAFTGPTFDTAQQTTEAFDQGVLRSPVVSTDVVATDPRGTRAGDLGYSSLNQANTTTDTGTEFTKPDVNLTESMVDPRAIYPEGMDPSKIKYTPPKVSETPIVTTPKVPNTTYQNVFNKLTPGDGKQYVNGKLLDDAGNQVNTLYQQTANLFTPFDGKEYENGVLVDSETKQPITQATQAATVAEPKRTEVWKDKLSGAALRAAQDAEKANYTGSTANDFAIGVISDGKTKGVLANAEGKVIRDANNRTVYVDAEGKQYVKTGILGTGREAPTGTVNSNKEDSGESKQQLSAPTVSVKPKVRKEDSGESKQKTSTPKIKEESIKSKISRGGGFNKGGLASKPIKTKKTKKRGLAAR
jgi:hypothetical protein